MLISVIVPVYNVENYLRRCLDSLVRQTYKELEIILVNDGSTDNSLLICKEYVEKYPHFKLVDKQNGGLGSARNAGLRASSGEYISFIDSDDWVADDMYEYMHQLLVQYVADVIDVGVRQAKSIDVKVETIPEKAVSLEGIDILRHYLKRGMSEKNGAPYSVCRKLYSKSLFAGEQLSFSEGTVNEDICFNFKILKTSKRIAVGNQIKYFYFQNDSSITNGELKNRDLDLLTVSNELVSLAHSTGDNETIRYAQMKQARSYFSLLARIAAHGFSKDITDKETLISELNANLRKQLPLLLASPMPLNRKILSVAFALNFNASKKLIGKMKKII